MSIKRKYIDSHWLIFALQGVLALLFGWYALFTNLNSFEAIIIIAGTVLLGLGIIEMLNLLTRTHLKETWGLSLLMAIFELAAAFALLFAKDQNAIWHLVIIGLYTIARGILETFIGLGSVDDLTDRFIWVLTGVSGCIIGIVVVNAGHLGNLPFIKYFGSYMMIFGVSNLIYAIHNKEQKHDYETDLREKRIESRERRAKNAKKIAAIKELSVKPDRVYKSKNLGEKAANKAVKKSTHKKSKKPTAKKVSKK